MTVKVNFSLQKDGYKKLPESIKKLSNHFKDNKKTFEKMADEVIYPEFDKVFKDWRGRWKSGKPMLNLSPSMKRLENSLTRKNAEGSLLKITKDEMIIGSKLKLKSGKGFGMIFQRSLKKQPIITNENRRKIFGKCTDFYMKNVRELKKKLWGLRKT